MTGAIFGRPSGTGHYLFNAPGCKAKKFTLPAVETYPRDLPVHNGKPSLVVMEIRGGDNSYTMIPPSVHPCGETLVWIKDEAPAEITPVDLHQWAGRHAVASTVLYFYPDDATACYEVRMALTGALARSGMHPAEVLIYVQAVAQLAGDPKWDEDFAERTAERLQKDEPVTGVPALVRALALPEQCERTFREWLNTVDQRSLRPTIRIVAGELSMLATEAEEYLLESDMEIYQRGQTLVRPIIEEVDAAHGRKTKVARFAEIGDVYLCDILGRIVSWERYDARSESWVYTDTPTKVARTLLARDGEWKFPKVAGVISTPTMRPDGTIIDKEGYDAVTHLLLVAPPPMPPMPDQPTKNDALRALKLLEGLLDEFPFVGDVDRSVALSGFITPVVRGAFPVAPMHAANAPVAGSGKSYLFDCVAAIAIGRLMPVMAAGRTEEETEKRLGAAIMTGQALVDIDNVNGELQGDALCQMIERPIVDVRVLGKSRNVRVEARGTTMFCNRQQYHHCW